MRGLEIETIPVGPFAANCYLVTFTGSESIAVVDPGAEPARLLEHIRRRRRPVAAYLLTHGHVDHLSALPELLRHYPAPAFLHPEDAAWACRPGNRIDPWYPPVRLDPETLEPWDPARLPEEWSFIRILHTPGHSPGSVCLLAGEVLFSGDTLFQGSVGRTDLPHGDARRLEESLRRLAALDPEILVLPGHGPATTIARERESGFLAGL